MPKCLNTGRRERVFHSRHFSRLHLREQRISFVRETLTRLAERVSASVHLCHRKGPRLTESAIYLATRRSRAWHRSRGVPPRHEFQLPSLKIAVALSGISIRQSSQHRAESVTHRINIPRKMIDTHHENPSALSGEHVCLARIFGAEKRDEISILSLIILSLIIQCKRDPFNLKE